MCTASSVRDVTETSRYGRNYFAVAGTIATMVSLGATGFDRETWLDLIVNIVPMGILVFFVVLFLLYMPWQDNLFLTAVSHFLTIFPLLMLILVTYISAKVISRDQHA